MMVAMDIDALLKRFPALQRDEKSDAVIAPCDIVMEVAEFLKKDSGYELDYLSNVSGVDYLPKEEKEELKKEEGEVETKIKEIPGYMEVVYHFYSMKNKGGLFVLKQRLMDRESPVAMSLMPLYRSAEFQEREVYDLFGIKFTGHPDLRRLFMWEEFEDFPLRKDYKEPDDYEYEPTAHDTVLEKSEANKSNK